VPARGCLPPDAAGISVHRRRRDSTRTPGIWALSDVPRAPTRTPPLWDWQPPGWVFKLETQSRFVFRNAEKLFKKEAGRGTRKKIGNGNDTESDLLKSSCIRQPWGQWEWPLTMSSPERAILELLDEVPERETFHQADVLMEGLRNLRPRAL
jgi:hypothetical protein